MIESFIPTYTFHHYSEVTPEFLLSKGICAIVSDIDNTLVTYDDEQPTPELLKWIEGMTKAGIQISFISNNTKERVRIFNIDLRFFARGSAKKPFKKYVLCALDGMNVDHDQACLMGDQLFTDIWAGNNACVRTILVDPIKDKKNPFTRLKRKIERAVMNIYEKKNGKK